MIPELSEYDRGYLACIEQRDIFIEMLHKKRPIEQSILRLAVEQGLCQDCKKIMIRFSEIE